MAVAGGAAVNIAIPNTGGDVTGCSAPNAGAATEQLPAGLMVSTVEVGGTRTCAITGTVAGTAEAGSYTVTITAASAAGATTVEVTIVVPAEAAPRLGDIPGLQELRVGSSANIPFDNSGGAVAANGCALAPTSAALPLGLRIEVRAASGADTCAITGMPTAIVMAPITITVRATSPGAATSDATVSISVSAPAPAAPDIADIAGAQTFTIGLAIDPLRFDNSGGDVAADGCAVSAGALPPGLMLRHATPAGAPATCEIHGVPDGPPASAAPLTVSATNAGGSDAATVSIATVSAPAPAAPDIADIAGAQTFTIGLAIDPLRFDNSGGDVAADGCAVSAGALPLGLMLRHATPAGAPATCEIHGVPDGPPASAAPLTVSATNAGGSDAATVSIATVSAPAPAAPDIADIAGAQTFTIGLAIDPLRFDNSGGDVAADGCAVSAGALPLGLALRHATPAGAPATCEIHGVPDGPPASAAPLTVSATNAGGSDAATVSIATVSAPAPAAPDIADIAGTQTFTIGLAIDPLRFDNSGGDVAADGCAVSAGALPLGLALRHATPAGAPATCEIHGVPDGPPASAAPLTVSATNAGGSDAATVSIATEAEALATQRPLLADVSETTLSVGSEATIEIPNSGGAVASRGCALAAGSLPAGLRLEAAVPTGGGEASCRILGMPTTVASATTVTVTGTNNIGSSMATVIITVNPPAPDLVDFPGLQSLPPGDEISPIVFDNNGGGSLSRCEASPMLPMGLTAEPTVGRDSCRITGTPASATAQATYTVTATNDGGSAMATVSLVVAVPPAQLQDINGVRSLTVGEEASIVFDNDGGDVDPGACSLTGPGAAPAPNGLTAAQVAATGSSAATCRITGIPAGPSNGDITLTISGDNASAMPSMATVTVNIAFAAPALTDFANAVRLFLGQQITGVVLTNNGGDVQASGCTITQPASPPSGIGVEDVAPPGGGARTCALAGTPQAVTQAPVTLTISGRNATGASTADVTIEVVLSAPSLQDIDESQSLLAGEALGAPIAFTNTSSGGLNAQSGSPEGCAIHPALPSGLAIERTNDGDSCQITGTPMAGLGSERTAYTVTATNPQGSASAGVSIIVYPDIQAQALGTHLEVEQSGARGWTIAATAAKDGSAALASGAAGEPGQAGESRSCLIADIELPGHFSFEWKAGQGQGALGFGAGDDGHDLPDTGAWESVHDELPLGSGGRAAQLSWCHRGEAAGAHLDNVSYTRAPTGLEAAPATATQVNLRWDTYPNANYYTVVRSQGTDPSAASEITVPRMQTGASLSDTGLDAGLSYHYWVSACNARRCSGLSLPATATAGPADADGDGLIDIHAAHQLHSVRHDLTGSSLRASVDLPGNSDGCPQAGGCNGYELLAPISLDSDGDGASWTRSADGALALDFDDHHHRHFNALDGGWRPLGDCGDDASCTASADNTAFTAIFDGAGHAITGLAILGEHSGIGMFAATGAGADIRGLGLIGNLAAHTGNAAGSIGGLIGYMGGGSLTASYTTGSADGGAGAEDIGALVGRQQDGSILATYTIGDVSAGGGSDNAGALVGHQSGGSIAASYATGDARGGAGHGDKVGALIGYQSGGSLVASYALGHVWGGAGTRDDGGALIGRQANAGASAADSWGFGEVASAENAGRAGSGSLPEGVRQPWQLDPDNTPSSWNAAATPSFGAWDFGSAAQAPALAYADYDASATDYHCASAASAESPAPANATLIPDCDAASTLIPGQRGAIAVRGIVAQPASATEISISWRQAANAAAYQVYRRLATATGAPERVGAMTQLLSLTDTGLTHNALYSYWVVACDSQGCPIPAGAPQAQAPARTADADADGLIEINTLIDLNAVRNSLDGSSYALAPGRSYALGCPNGACTGYELTADLSFDADASGWTWRRAEDGSLELDSGDHLSGIFDTDIGGWIPIGDCGADGVCDNLVATSADESADNRPFTAIFDGAGHSITGLASLGVHSAVGMFGLTAGGASIRGLGLEGGLAAYVGLAGGVGTGGLIGRMDGGSVAACHTSGDAVGSGDAAGNIGALVGLMSDGSIAASYASGAADGGAAGGDAVGGLVGAHTGGSITASYAVGEANGAGGQGDSVGGLVGQQGGGSIAASYASGAADGGAGDGDRVGGLVGHQGAGSITAAYALAKADGGAGNGDFAGRLVGAQETGATIAASWGFGAVAGSEMDAIDSSDDRPVGATRVEQLTIGAGTNTDVPAAWNAPDGNTLNAWDFGTAVQSPALKYADYDGVAMGTSPAYTGGHRFHCADDNTPPPAGAVLVPGCDATPALIPGQRALRPVERVALSYTGPASPGQSGTLRLDWTPASNALGYRVFRGASDDAARATELTDAPMDPIDATHFVDSGVDEDAAYHYWVQACSAEACVELGDPASTLAFTADADGNGLIDIATLEQLHSIRHSLDGSRYRSEAGSLGSIAGCPLDGACVGFELTADISLDGNANGWTWRRVQDGSLELDSGDRVGDIYNPGVGGWVPIGDCGADRVCKDDAVTNADEAADNRPFTAIFDGAGHSITGLASLADHGAVGLFGLIGEGANIRRLALSDNLAAYTGVSHIGIGGLVGQMSAGRVTACHATGEVVGSALAAGSLGGLVGIMDDGAITASFASGSALALGTSSGDKIGGLAGQQSGGAITASYATGAVVASAGVGGIAGGLVGDQAAGAITASYATGAVDGGAGNSDTIGGLVGQQSAGSITASYATGAVDGGAGSGDRVGSLVGIPRGPVTVSWGFGAVDGEEADGSPGSNDRPTAAMQAQQLTIGTMPAGDTDVLGLWNEAGRNTLGAWDFATKPAVPPQLGYADYDGDGAAFHCASSAEGPPDDAIVIPDCDAILPRQFIPASPGLAAAQASATSAQLSWVAATNAASYRVWRGTSADFAEASEQTDNPITATTYTDDGLVAGTDYFYWVIACIDAAGQACSEPGAPARARGRVADIDSDGLIEIFSAAELAIMANDLAGASYKATDSSAGMTSGCPLTGCFGYELMADIDFDIDGDGSTWSGASGSYTLDSGDNAPYFDAAGGGWTPVGASASTPFSASFEGNGYAVRGLATIAATGEAGMFGHLADSAVVRNLGLVGNLAARATAGAAGGIAAVSAGDIIAAYTTGPAHASGSGASSVGGLVGSHDTGSIQSCFARGDTGAATGSASSAGGLVGAVAGGSITASYATGAVSGSGADGDLVGGLVGSVSGGTITASWANGDVDGVAGDDDAAAKLIGSKTDGDVVASWGYGAIANGDTTPEDSNADDASLNGSGNRPSAATTAQQLTIGANANTDVPASWGEVDSNTLGAWHFGGSSELPSLNYADYDGATMTNVGGMVTGGQGFHCAGETPGGDDSVAIALCEADAPLSIPSQAPLEAPEGLSISIASAGEATLSWQAVRGAEVRLWRAPAAGGEGSLLAQTRGNEHSDDGIAIDSSYRYWAESCAAGACSTIAGPLVVTVETVDADGDGLIEISTARELHNIRHHLDGAAYGQGPDIAVSIGCPAGSCTGYELSANISFDSDNDGSTWSGAPGSYEIDDGDHDPIHFDTTRGGWAPVGIGPQSAFTGIFDGNGHTITGLATFTASGEAGLFGFTSVTAKIRNLGLVDNLAARTSAGPVGGIVAVNRGDITASYTTGPVHSSGNGINRVGALVGRHIAGAIQSCFALGDVNSGAGDSTSAGGLASDIQVGATITASYATGNVTGSAAGSEGLGAFVGWMPDGTITASWASGDVDSAEGDTDFAGRFIGAKRGGEVIASWGFGASSNGDGTPFSGSDDRPEGVYWAEQITIGTGADTDVPASWNQASSNTLGAWNFGSGSGLLGLNYADYDGVAMPAPPNTPTSGHRFHCASDAANAPDGALTIAGGCAPPSLIPGQLMHPEPSHVAFTPVESGDGQGPDLRLWWAGPAGADGWRVLRNTLNDLASAETISGDTPLTLATYTDTDISVGAIYHYWVAACVAGLCREPRTAFTTPTTVVDADNDGLIEISTARELHNIRFALDGAGYRTEAGGSVQSLGCPIGGCIGYELDADIDFDVDGDNSVWRGVAGSYALDDGDHDPIHFDTAAGGWAPMGTSAQRAFSAILDGNGHTITGLATIAASGGAGMFGYLGSDAEVRNLGLVGNLAVRSTSGGAGGLAIENSGDIIASWATGPVYVSGNDRSYVGGFVGAHVGGSIQSCFAAGNVGSDSGVYSRVGGLVGRQDNGSITASYATGEVRGSSLGNERIGGLVGLMLNGSVTASWAGADVDGVSGDSDAVAQLIGLKSGGSVTDSWGFGAISNGDATPVDGNANNASLNGSAGRPVGASAPEQLSIGTMSAANTDVPASWNQADSNTLGAWSFGTAEQTPALNYADYDGATMGTAPSYTSGHLFHCATDEANAPVGAALIAGGCETPSPFPLQRAPQTVRAVMVNGYTAPAMAGQRGAITIGWQARGNADGYRVFRSLSGDFEDATEVTDSTASPTAATEIEDSEIVPGSTYHYRIQSCRGTECYGFSQPVTILADIADADGDGLIEVANLTQLHNMRHDLEGSSRRTAADGPSSSFGCPSTGCHGYELTADLDFDSDGDGMTWSGRPGSYALDSGDHNPVYFDTAAGGWQPVGATSTNSFRATFEGNGHKISGLATIASTGSAGMFGYLSSAAELRNTGLVRNLAVRKVVGAAGGLVAEASGDIIASYTTGPVYTSGDGINVVGALVGLQLDGFIQSCFATGDTRSAGGTFSRIGGLVGRMDNAAAITASYAIGDVSGSSANTERIGGLVGFMANGAVTASWAGGDVDGVSGDNDAVAQLIGLKSGGSVTDSWGFGAILNSDVTPTDGNDNASLNGSTGRPMGASAPQQLSIGTLSAANTDVPSTWDQAASNTLGAWNLNPGELPALNYADYDGETMPAPPAEPVSGNRFHCDSDAANAPDGASLIAGDCATTSLIPGQSNPEPPPGLSLVLSAADTITLTWQAVAFADTYEVWRGTSADFGEASKISADGFNTLSLADDGRSQGQTYHYWVLSCPSDGCRPPADGLAPHTSASVRPADADADGLIEITSLQELHNIRHDLAGSSLVQSIAPSVSNSIGCPVDGCFGYELTADLSFDANGNGWTWQRADNGSVSLDAGDHHPAYFAISEGGWEPIGASATPFIATFDGNGHSITGLASLGNFDAVGMFAFIGEGAAIRGLGLIDNLADYTGTADIGVGGLVGRMNAGSVTACHTTGDAVGARNDAGRVGGLVGHFEEGSITGSWASGDAIGSGDSADSIGGLVGYQGSDAAITASHASGDVFGGGGGTDRIGGLVGYQGSDAAITASHASGDVIGGGGGADRIGGLVGYLDGGSIKASHASGSVDGGGGDFDYVGGLVGWQDGSSAITATYATGDASGGDGNGDRAAGLVGFQNSGAITASYATGDSEGGSGSADLVDSLVGRQVSGSVTASWGFGAADGEGDGVDGSDDLPAAVLSAPDLSIDSSSQGTDVPDSWNAAASASLGAWRFLGGVQPPVLLNADYDGSGDAYHCADAASPPDEAIIVPRCGELVVGQAPVAILGVGAVMGSATTATLSWRPSALAHYYRVLRAPVGEEPADAAALTSGATQTDASYALSGLAAGTVQDYWLLGCVSIGAEGIDDDACSPFGQAFTLEGRDADIDGNGLIEIGNAAELAIIANDRAGASYKATADGAGFDDGCPAGGCSGYELSANISFDIDGDGASWSRDADGGLRFDAGDNQPAYFDVSAGGWTPIGDCGEDEACVDDPETNAADEAADNRPFTATFDGAGHAITGLATLGDHAAAGMFGLVGNGARILGLALIDNLAARSGADDGGVGGLAGRMEGGAVVACLATGDAVGSATASDDIGGLVGRLSGGSIIASFATGSALAAGAAGAAQVGALVGWQSGGSITASYASGAAAGGAGDNDSAGGLVGRHSLGSITASYASASADGGAGDGDHLASLVGQEEGGSITASWGFGIVAGGEEEGSGGSSDRPPGATAPIALTIAPHGLAATNVPGVWNVGSSRSLGAWDFGAPLLPPALRYADYDGDGGAFHCKGAALSPVNAILIPLCGSLLPGQRALAAPAFATASAVADDGLSLAWAPDPSATYYRILRGSTAVQAEAEDITPPGGVAAPAFTDEGLDAGTTYHYWVLSCNVLGCSPATTASATSLAVATAPILEPIAMPGARALYRYEIGRAYPAERRIGFVNRAAAAITGCSAASDDLPRGMAIDTTTCAITGSPSRRSEQLTEHTITATSAMGAHSVVIAIETHHLNPPDLSSTTSGEISLAEGQMSGFPISLPNTGGFPTQCRAFSGGANAFLPDSLDLSLNRSANGQGCELSLLDPTRGIASFSRPIDLLLEAVNAAGSSSASIRINVGMGDPPSALVVDGGASDFTFAANSAIAPITFTRTGAGLCAVAGASGASLPAGLSLDQATCRISGLPTEVLAQTTYTLTLSRGSSSANEDISIAVSDARPALEASVRRELFQGSPDGLPAIVPATAGVPTLCTATSAAVAQGTLADNNLYLYATGAGCAIDSIDGQGPAHANDDSAYTLSYEISARNGNGESESASALSLDISPRLPARAAPGGPRACATNAAGRLYCWGRAGPALGLGELGRDRNLAQPANVGDARGWRSPSVGASHACAINASGQLHCWGDGSDGRLGNDDTNDATAPQRIGSGSDWAQVSVGASHACAINASGQLHCWGNGTSGRLGHDSTSYATAPQRIDSAKDWAQVSAGGSHTCAITVAGQLHCWGFGGDGRLGNGATGGADTPQRVGSRSDWAQVSAGGSHSCATTSSGQLHCWGSGADGRLGNGATGGADTPQRVGSRSDWAQVSAGGSHSCALTTSGQLHCWGEYTKGRLGLGSVSADQTRPAQVTGAGMALERGWLSVSSANSLSCGARRAGDETELWCWGSGRDGTLGDGDDSDHSTNVPVQVPLP